MNIPATPLCRAIRFAALVFGVLLLLVLLCPNQPAQSDDGVGACRNSSSGPGCAAACSLLDPENCSDSIKDMLLIGLVLLIVAIFAVALYPEVFLAAVGAGASLLTSSMSSVWGALGLAAAGGAATLGPELPTLEQSLIDVTNEANVAIQAAAIEAQAFMDGLNGVLANLNALGGLTNCAWCAQELDQALTTLFDGGVPDAYAPAWYNPSVLNYVPDADGQLAFQWGQLDQEGMLESQYGSSFDAMPPSSIVDELTDAGDGSRGIVSVTDGVNAHAYNAFNYNGQIYFADGQSGKIWTNPYEAAGYEQSSVLNFRFLRTD
jgi:hypothetical protein